MLTEKILNVQPRKSQDQESPRVSPKPVDDINLPDANNEIDDLHENNDNNGQQPENDRGHNSPVNGNDALPAPTPAPPTATATAPTPAPPLDHSPSHHLNFTNHSPSSNHNSHVPYLSSPDFMGLISHSSFSEGYPAAMASPLFNHGVFSDPANVANIDVFVPGSAYEALHTALRNRQLWTARPDIPSRGSTPDIVPGVAPNDTGARSGREFTLSSEREIILWQNYLNEICTWVGISRYGVHAMDANILPNSSTCLITIATSHQHFHRWPSHRRICDSRSLRYLHDKWNGNKTKNRNRRVYLYTKKPSTSYYQNWKVKQHQ